MECPHLIKDGVNLDVITKVLSKFTSESIQCSSKNRPLSIHIMYIQTKNFQKVILSNNLKCFSIKLDVITKVLSKFTFESIQCSRTSSKNRPKSIYIMYIQANNFQKVSFGFLRPILSNKLRLN